MKSISVYDLEEQKIDHLCNEYDTTEAELIEALIDAVESGEIELADWL